MTESVDDLRCQRRIWLGEKRSESKMKRLMSARSVPYSVAECFKDDVNIEDFVKMLKGKGPTEIEVMVKLQQAFMRDPQYAEAFLAVSGAYAELVRSLSGSRPIHALHASFCLCNLSANPSKLSAMHTKIVAPFLMLHLDGMNDEFLDSCAWTVGNLSLVDQESWKILHSLGSLQKLANLVNHPKEGVVMSTVYSLTHIVLKAHKTLSESESRLIASVINAQTVFVCDASRLLFQLSTTSYVDTELSSEDLVRAVVKKWHDLIMYSDLSEVTKISEVTYLVRYLGNVSCTNSQSAFHVIRALTESKVALAAAFKTKFPHLIHELCWLLKNLQCHSDEEVRVLTSKTLGIGQGFQ
ncbi:uncharacterized protein LOC135944285 [Cloeon dipterum]|uniref:uncharacterized protein LOC135944285 n=1 Tax=Cloeon dipterum TaxID=197152 RepID=UPI00321FE999